MDLGRDRDIAHGCTPSWCMWVERLTDIQSAAAYLHRIKLLPGRSSYELVVLVREILVLSHKEVEGLLDYGEVIDAVENAFRAKALGRTIMPPKSYLFFAEYCGDLRVMPAYLLDEAIAGVKIVNVHPENPRKHGIASVMAVVVLVDPETGRPLAVMDGTLITAWRTGAAGAVAAKYLARRDSKVMGVIGAGVQGRMQALFTSKVLDLDRLVVWDVVESRAEAYAEEMSRALGIGIKVAGGPEEVAREADILATCTPSREPIVKAEWIRPGIHINAIGADAPGKEELDPEILKRASKIVVDDWVQASHSGEINVPLSKGIISKEDIYAELGEIIAGMKPGRERDDEITVFDSTGSAIQDVATASIVYRKALDRRIGTRMEIVKM